MKPFNLEAAKAGAQVITRDGRKARIVCFDRASSSGKYPLVVLIESCEDELPLAYTMNGESRIIPNDDLFMAPVKEERWVNIYPGDYENCMHKSEKIANAKASENRIACIKIEYEA